MIRRPVAIAAGVAVVLVAGCSVAYAQTQNSSGSYRTAAVAVGDVNQTLSLSGTITASSRRDLSFGASGTVKKVKVASGDVVRSGQTLATLDATDLSAAVTKARATLAKAKAQLETDQNSQTATVTAATTSASTSTAAKSSAKKSSGSSGSSSDDSAKKSTESQQSSSPALTKALAKLKAQQAAVTSAQTASTQAITAAKAALAAQVKACEDATEITEAAEPAEGEEAEDPTASLSAECTTALDGVQAAQDVVAAKQDTLQAALQTLAGTLSEAAKATSTTTGGAPSSGSTDSGSTKTEEPSASTPSASAPSASAPSTSAPSGGSGSGSGSGGSGGGVTVTAATLAKDQAEIDTARAALAEAKQTREAAELTAPFAGEVLSVSVAKGDDVSSSDVVIVMIGTGSTTATTTVTLEQVAKVSKGQKAQITPAGASASVAGTVTSIGMLPDSSSDTSTYPVTIDLDDDVAAPEGSTATISLIIGTAEDVLTVPSSAVTTTGRSTVSVLADGKVSMAPVTVGVIGSTRTEITEGLTKGQTVVLGDLNASLPGGDGTTTSLPTSGRGGFGGGGMPGGGRSSGGGRG